MKIYQGLAGIIITIGLGISPRVMASNCTVTPALSFGGASSATVGDSVTVSASHTESNTSSYDFAPASYTLSCTNGSSCNSELASTSPTVSSNKASTTLTPSSAGTYTLTLTVSGTCSPPSSRGTSTSVSESVSASLTVNEGECSLSTDLALTSGSATDVNIGDSISLTATNTYSSDVTLEDSSIACSYTSNGGTTTTDCASEMVDGTEGDDVYSFEPANAGSYTVTYSASGDCGTGSAPSDSDSLTFTVTDATQNDEDGDGYTTDAGDCDDADPARYPGATETCGNEIDEDCDGNDTACADVADADGDGYTTEGGDCDDSDSSISPGATEICNNNLDDDCDDATSDTTGTIYYYDGDQDGYGGSIYTDSSTGSAALCQAPSVSGTAFVTNSEDCDDADSDINPGADEICSDTANNDCDAETDEDDCVASETGSPAEEEEEPASQASGGCGCDMTQPGSFASLSLVDMLFWFGFLVVLLVLRKNKNLEIH